MKVTSSYAVHVQDHRQSLKATVSLYRAAVAFMIDVVDKEWDTLPPICAAGGKLGQHALEHMIHKTKGFPKPKYNFDEKFYKFPSYFRRAAITMALGAVSSYRKNLANWEAGGKQGRPPKLAYDRNVMPVFFRGNMSECESMLQGETTVVQLKLFVKNDWVWVDIHCRPRDVKYLVKWWSGAKASAPTLEVKKRKGRRDCSFRLRFAYEEYRDLSLRDEPLDRRLALAVDLGINNDAVCSVMAADGAILGRMFINFPREKDRMNHLLNKQRGEQRDHGRYGGRRTWDQINNLNDQLSANIARAIVDMAVEHGVNVIVFEALDFHGRIRGRKAQRLHLWRKRAIQDMVEHKAHRNLIRISRVCAWGTSRLAFDGSGEILRGRVNLTNDELAALIAMETKDRKKAKGRPETHCGQERCTFLNGKEYNCDLSASYNIGARYFLREWCKVTPGLEETLPKTTQRTYANLKALKPQHSYRKAAA